MKKHKHWITKGLLRENVLHSILIKHTDIYSQKYHDIKTGKFMRWVKKNKLNLVDATYEKYEKEVLRKEIIGAII